MTKKKQPTTETELSPKPKAKTKKKAKPKTKSKAKHRPAVKTLEMAELYFHLPLKGDKWTGPNGAQWTDIAVDSSGNAAIVWVRKQTLRAVDKYFLVVSTVRAHVLAYELTIAEAKELYYALPNRAPYDIAFDKNLFA